MLDWMSVVEKEDMTRTSLMKSVPGVRSKNTLVQTRLANHRPIRETLALFSIPIMRLHGMMLDVSMFFLCPAVDPPTRATLSAAKEHMVAK